MNFIKKIDNQLDNQNIISIAYNVSITSDASSLKTNINHGSTIVGRKFNEKTGHCEFLLRNVHGRICSEYDSSYTCESGHIWISKFNLMRSVTRITYLE